MPVNGPVSGKLPTPNATSALSLIPRPAGSAPALSVAMSCYNSEPYTALAIESILAQTFGDFEFLIVDDGSKDGTAETIMRYADRDKRIRPILRENRGLVASLNQMLSLARAPWIARMDADDVCRPDRFARQMKFLREHPDHGLVSSNCDDIGPDGEPVARPPIYRPMTHEGLLANLECGPTINHNAVIYLRSAVLSVGGYRPAFAHAEDYDLWLRLSQVTKMANLPEDLCSYRLYPGQVSDRHLITQAYHAGVAWLCHLERAAGRPDPMAGRDRMLAVDELDGVFGAGAAARVRRRVIERSLYAPQALAGDGWQLLLGYAAENRRDPRLWRLSARLLAHGHPLQAGRLGARLAFA